MKETEALLRRLAASDEDSLRSVLDPCSGFARALGRDAHALVQLSALLAAEATTTSLRWATDVACAAGVDDVTLAEVLVAIAPVAGTAQTAASAPRLALALDCDLDTRGESGPTSALPE